jgi:hypothetical protein
MEIMRAIIAPIQVNSRIGSRLSSNSSNESAICQILKVWEVSTGVRQMLQSIPDGQNGVLLGLNPRVKA